MCVCVCVCVWLRACVRACALRRDNAVSRLATTVQWLQRISSPLAAVAVRILARVVGDNVRELLDTIHGRTSAEPAAAAAGAGRKAGGGRRSVLESGVSAVPFTASLFASLMSDRDIATNLVRQGLHVDTLALLKTALSPPVLLSVLQALR